MRDLRLVGVHEDGQHVLLADDEGGRYRLSLDDALRAAARRDRPRLGQLQIELDGGMRPREVQALIRSGLGAEEVAERAGWTVEKVGRYEGPVLAERDHVARLAREVRMRSAGRSPEQTLAGRVGERLADRGVEPAEAAWDAARDGEGHWAVLVRFTAGGRQRTAAWAFDLDARSVSPRDDEARWLTADDTEPPGPLTTGQGGAPSAAEADVYDVDSDGGVEGTARRPSHEPVDLMAALRESSSRGRRSRRRGAHQPTLAAVEDIPAESVAEATPEPSHDSRADSDPSLVAAPPVVAGSDAADAEGQAAGPRPTEAQPSVDPGVRDAGAPGVGVPDAGVPDAGVPDAGVPDAGVPDEGDGGDDGSTLAGPTTTPEPSAAPAATTSDAELAEGPGAAASSEDPTPPDADGDDHASTGSPRRGRSRRGGRTSVPRWDDVMFGARGSSPQDE